MKGWLHHNLLRGIALRFVKPRGRLRFSKYVGDAVITDSIARAEIAMGVVVECAPTNAAGVLRIGRKLVMHPSMTNRMFGEAFHLVDGLRRVGLAHKLRIQISRMIGRLHREPQTVPLQN